MRKRTVKNLCKEIFWHIVYFLPIVIALFSMLLFTTETYASSLVAGVDDNGGVVTDLTDTTWTFNELLIFQDANGVAYQSSFNIEFDNDGAKYFEFGYGYDLNGNASYEVYYDYTYFTVYNSIDNPSWGDDAYRIIHIVGGDDVTNPMLIDFLSTNAMQESVVVDSNGSVYDLMIDSLDSSFEVMGLNFENDYLFNGLNQVFVNGGILSVFKDTSILLKFACYYFYVHIIHLFIDTLLFIPKIAHKWIESLMRCE